MTDQEKQKELFEQEELLTSPPLLAAIFTSIFFAALITLVIYSLGYIVSHFKL